MNQRTSTKRNMGLLSVGCCVENHSDPKRTVVIPRIPVDNGSGFTFSCRALEGLNLRVDSRAKRLASTGLAIAAAAIKPRLKTKST